VPRTSRTYSYTNEHGGGVFVVGALGPGPLPPKSGTGPSKTPCHLTHTSQPTHPAIYCKKP